MYGALKHPQRIEYPVHLFAVSWLALAITPCAYEAVCEKLYAEHVPPTVSYHMFVGAHNPLSPATCRPRDEALTERILRRLVSFGDTHCTVTGQEKGNRKRGSNHEITKSKR